MKYRVGQIIFYILSWIAAILPAIILFRIYNPTFTKAEEWQLTFSAIFCVVIISCQSLRKSGILRFHSVWLAILYFMIMGISSNILVLQEILKYTLIGCVVDDFLFYPLSQMFKRRADTYVNARINKQVFTE